MLRWTARAARHDPGMAIPLRRLAGLAVAGTLALTGCDLTPSHSDDAADLRATLRGLAGVEDVTLDYVEPQTFDSADVNLEVTMAADAMPADVAAVFEAAYGGLTDEHHAEEGNLGVRFDDDRLELRTFQSEAAGADVAAAAALGAEQALLYRRTLVQVNTQDVVKDPQVESTFYVALPRGTNRQGVSAVRSEIEDAYDGLLVEVSVRIGKPDW